MPALERLARAMRRLSAINRHNENARDLDEEMRFHRELLARDLESDGLSPSEARAAARRQFGNHLKLREEGMDAWRIQLFDEVAHDVRFGFRLLRRSPGFAIVSIVAIGLAIGINSGFFTLVDAFVWRPIPVPRAEQIVKVTLAYANGSSGLLFSYPQVQAIARAATLADVLPSGRCAQVAFRASVTAPARAVGPACISGNYFQSLGASAAIGRPLVPSDDRADAPPAVVISDQFWTREFSRAADIVGRDVVINGMHATVVGVIRANFVGLVPLIPDFWMTIPTASRLGATPGQLTDADNHFIDVRARMKSGVRSAQVAAEVSGIVAEQKTPGRSRADDARVTGAIVTPNESMLPMNATTIRIIAPALVLVVLVLVIACANLGNLLLSRALARQREIAVRLSLGASRSRLLRQLLTESMVIALLGSTLGFAAARWTVTAISRAFFGGLPSAFGAIALDLQPSWHAVAYTIALGALSVLIFGLAPALHATSPSLTASLKGDDAVFGTRLRRSRFRDALVAIQVAGCLVLLVASGMLAASIRTLGGRVTGFSADRVTVATFGLSAVGRVPPALDSARTTFAGRSARVPTVDATARVLFAPFTSWFPLLAVATAEQSEYHHIQYNAVTPRYFDVVGQRIVSGRGFSADDSASETRVAVVTAAAARRLWPSSNAVGQTLRVARGTDAPDEPFRVVGIAADAHAGMIWDDDSDGYVFLPATARDFAANAMPLLVRSETPEPVLARSLEDIAKQVDPNTPVHMNPALVTRAQMMTPIQYGAWITSAVGAFGLALALIGLYGVVAFAVTQRRQEIAIHVAMGAQPGNVLRLVLRRELRLVLLGLAVGLVFAAGESRLIAAKVVQLQALSAAEFAAIPVLLFFVAAVASLVPALGALKIAPMQILRRD